MCLDKLARYIEFCLLYVCTEAYHKHLFLFVNVGRNHSDLASVNTKLLLDFTDGGGFGTFAYADIT